MSGLLSQEKKRLLFRAYDEGGGGTVRTYAYINSLYTFTSTYLYYDPLFTKYISC